MKTYSVLIREISPFGQEHRIEVSPSQPVVIQPGQYYLAYAPGTDQILPVALFPCAAIPDGLSLCGKLPPAWQTGATLLLQGPYGQGFMTSLKMRKLVIYAADNPLETRLFLLAKLALQRGADVAWVTDNLSIELPPQVEVLKTSEFAAAVDWCDACAIALSQNHIADFRQAHPLKQSDLFKIEVLFDTPMICGNAHCGVCAVETNKGWKLACKDGPVFRLEDLPRE